MKAIDVRRLMPSGIYTTLVALRQPEGPESITRMDWNRYHPARRNRAVL